MKVILKPKSSTKKSKEKERITIQFRSYDKDGRYTSDEVKGSETIHLKNCNILEAYEIVKSSLMNSRLISEEFEVVNE